MYQEATLPGWGTIILQQPPPLISDERVRKVGATDVRHHLTQLLATTRAQQDPALAPVVALLKYAHQRIQEIGAQGQVANLLPREVQREVKGWTDLELLATSILTTAAAKVKPTGDDVTELLRRWLVLRMQDIQDAQKIHEIDGYQVVGGIIKPRGVP